MHQEWLPLGSSPAVCTMTREHHCAASGYGRCAGSTGPANGSSKWWNSPQTNDLGEYRIFDLPPGRYFVSATIERPRINGDSYVAPAVPIEISESDRGYRFDTTMSGAAALAESLVSVAALDTRVFLPVYYPNTRHDADAVSVDVRPGVSLNGIDFTLSPAKTVHVRGHVINGVTGRPVPNQPVLIFPLDAGVTDALGTFNIPGVPAGRYELWSSISRLFPDRRLQSFFLAGSGDFYYVPSQLLS